MTRTDVRVSAVQMICSAVLTAMLTVCVLLLSADRAAAQVHPGIRGGVSVAAGTRVPDVTTQMYVGAHLETRPVVGRLVFRPNVETGFLDDLVVVALNGEFAWKFRPRASGWAAYVGGGPEVEVFRFGSDRFGQRDMATAAGLRFLVGFEYRSGAFIEVKLGTTSRPDIVRPLLTGLREVKVAAGYTWR